MPLKLKDDKGNEVEVPTQDEINELISKAKTEAVDSTTKQLEDKYRKDIDENNKKLSTLTTELEVAKEALDKSGEGTKDWAEARKLIKKLEGEINTINKERETEKEQFAKDLREVRSSTFKNTVDGWMDSLSQGDPKIKEKLEYHYNRLGANVKDEKEAMEVIKDAHLLATGKQAPNMLNVARGFGGEAPRVNEPIQQEVADLGKKMGISDADITKYSAKSAEKKQGVANQN